MSERTGDSRRRVARLVERLPPAQGGKEVHAAELTRAMAARGVAQHVFCRFGDPVDGAASQSAWPGPARLAGNVRLAAWGAWVVRAIRIAHRRRPFDLIHAHGDFPEAIAAATLSATLRVPALLTVHGGLSNTVWHDEARLASFSAMQEVVVVSNEIAADLRRIGVSSPITVTPSGVRDEFFEERDAPTEPVVVAVGRLAPVKGLESLIAARDAMDGGGLRWTVVADGHGAYADGIRAAIARRPDMSCVVLSDPGELAKLLRSATAFVLPSVDLDGQREGVPTALLEAMATGAPVVATDTGGVADVLDAGAGGLLVPPSDPAALALAISEIVGDRQAADERAHHARSSGRARTWGAVAEQVDGVYERAAAAFDSPGLIYAVPWFAVGGAEQIVAHLAEDSADRGVRVAVAGAPGEMVERLDGGVGFAPLRFGWSPAVVAHNAVAFTGLGVRLRPRAVNSHHFLTGLSARAGLAAARVRARHVMTVHGTERSLYDPVIGTLGPYLFDCLLPVAEVVRAQFARWAPPWRRGRFQVVHAGVEEPPPVAEVRERVVGVVARLVGRKGHRVLLDAWARVQQDDEGAEWSLELWGEGPDRDLLQDQIARLGIGHSVRMLGSVPDAASRLGEFPMIALPSLREGLPLLLIEAMAAGVPVVASDLPGTRELIGERAGLLVPPQDVDALSEALLSLVRDPARRSELAQAGRRRVREHFSRSRMVRDYLDALGVAISPCPPCGTALSGRPDANRTASGPGPLA